MLNKPLYRFQSSAKGRIVFDVSDLRDDYGQFHSKRDAVLFAKRFITFSRLWLEKHGYSPVEIRIVPQWNRQKSDYGYLPDEQRDLREAIFRDFLSPLNMGKHMSEWQGVSGMPSLEWYTTGNVPK